MGKKKPSSRFSKNNWRQIEGRHVVLEALRAGKKVLRIFIEEHIKFDDKLTEIKAKAMGRDIDIFSVSSNKLRKLSRTDSHHQGIIAYVELEEELNLRKILEKVWQEGREPFFLILSKILYEHNLGAVLRSAESCGVDAVIVPNRSFDLTPVVSRTAVGAEEYIPLIHDNLFSVLKYLQKEGILILGTSEKEGKIIYRQNMTRGLVLVMGAEDRGVSQPLSKLINHWIKIPMLGRIGSLNMSVAAAVCLYEVVRQRKYNLSNKEN